MQQRPLCAICRSIPHGELPPIPLEYKSTALQDQNGIEHYYFIAEEYIHDLALGWLHQRSLASLEISAATCEMCKLLFDARRDLIASMKEACKDEQFQQYNRMGVPSDGPLGLVQRNDEGDGFLAVVKATAMEFHAWYIIAGVGYCVKEDDPLSTMFRGRPVELNSGDSLAFKRVIKWVNHCAENHANCKRKINFEMPRRILDLKDNFSTGHIKLIETGEIQEPYITLSHCWGSVGHFTTTKSSLADRHSGISFDALPKTFQDAVIISQQLEIRYLWIDSLCICQDDSTDWERESARMASIYSNSYLTIAASSAKDSFVGCFNSHPRTYVEFCDTAKNGTTGQILAFLLPIEKVYNRAYRKVKWLEMRSEPLSGRGWAFQERLLARRMLYYASDQIYFECKDSFISEDGVKIQGPFNPIDVDVEGVEVNSYSGDSQKLQGWPSVVWGYTLRQLTKPDDIFPALSGLAKAYQERVKDEYIAGIWKQSLLNGGLTWLVSHRVDAKMSKPAPSRYRAPSWSWASLDCPIRMTIYDTTKISPLAVIIDIHIELKGENPFGEVSGGWLKLRAPKVKLFERKEKKPSYQTLAVPHTKVIRFTTEYGNISGEYAILDNIDQSDWAQREVLRNTELFFLAIQKYRISSTLGYKYMGLIITPVDGEDETFKRLGMLTFNDAFLGDVAVVEGKDLIADVTLV